MLGRIGGKCKIGVALPGGCCIKVSTEGDRDMTDSFSLMDFVGNVEHLTGKIAAVYTMRMGYSSQEVHPTVIFFYNDLGSISVGTTMLRQGFLPLVKLGCRQDFDSARKHAQDLINRGYELNRAWM